MNYDAQNSWTYLLLREIIWQVGNHDLVLGWNAIGWRTTLTSLTGLARSLGLGLLLSGGLVGGVGQRRDLSGGWDLSTIFATRLLGSQ